MAKTSIDYDFDIHSPLSFMYYFTRQYMDQTYKSLQPFRSQLSGKILYDIGVGRGRSLALFKSLGIKKVVGFDVNHQEANFALSQAKRVDLKLQIIIDSYQNEELKKLSANSCDVVSLMNILFCVPSDQVRRTLINQAKRILKPGGILIIVDMQKPSGMWLLSFLTGKSWKFRNYNQLLNLLSPLKVVAYAPSNHFYFINQPIDLINKLLGFNICYSLDNLCKILGVPASTKTFVFTKP